MSPEDFVRAAIGRMAPLADAGKARQMRAYLRDQHDFLGVPAPARRAAIAGIGACKFEQGPLLQTVDLLWALPQREYRYVATGLLARNVARVELGSVDHLLRLAQIDLWWETVDGLSGVISDIILRERACDPNAQEIMDASLAHPSLWVRRIAMIHQLGWRQKTDSARLYSYAATLAHEPDFFIRKAIGWALRDYARWEPASVKNFVTRKDLSFSPLTVREALKHID
ncbi:DNA alkylation repair protein [Massilia glaciei]|uniref:DNA alkylation repair protein n=1 Tax=Massilia glaciei TaxID=1524097 RepID=A0A2U2HP10_9BURK|nr:DNA alkylation repair protein [Massilia glaciei]PWF49233.1 DNA alkylation repair protein [Massilia glaciei]